MNEVAQERGGEPSRAAGRWVNRDTENAMSLKVAERGKVDPFIVMDVLRAANKRAAEGGDVLHLEVGQPGHAARPRPRATRPSGRSTASSSATPTRWGFRSCAARSRAATPRRHGVDLDPERVMITNGSSAGFVVAFLTAFDAGDRVALAAPGYPAYRTSSPPSAWSRSGSRPIWKAASSRRRSCSTGSTASSTA
ncbi:MAG: aminotransferase class I/II-fold pyridoxal phosphate-dependent enzyme [Xanthomonadales bacterium]|nr:aminotransferase class I/II-fold pyridoxal phosphate-dependent enzyme [Xanthomonadales bacterium]